MVSMPSTVRNQELWNANCRRIRSLASRVISGEIGVVAGSEKMLRFKTALHDKDGELFRVFEWVLASSTHLPIGVDPALWHHAPLAAKKL